MSFRRHIWNVEVSWGVKPGMGGPFPQPWQGQGGVPRPRGVSTQRKGLRKGGKAPVFKASRGSQASTQGRLCVQGPLGVVWKERVSVTTRILSVSGKEPPTCPPRASWPDRIFAKVFRGARLLTHTQELTNLSKTTGLWSAMLGHPPHRGAIGTGQ